LEQSSADKILAALTVEHAALQGFVALLEREQAMLVDNHNDQLLALSEQKTADALTLNNLAHARRALLREHIPELGVDSIQVWLKNHCPEGLPVWQNILGLAKRSQQLNLANGELIQMKLRHNQQSLAALSNAANRANLYGPASLS
jgi:flagella synthesis protein FlgN